MDKLKECPFCGGEANTTGFRGITGFICGRCEAVVSFKHREEHEQAISAWNTRPERWIPVTKRLPESQQRVITQCKIGPVVVGWLIFDKWHTDFGRIYKNCEVTHWMPLPLPPKGE